MLTENDIKEELSYDNEKYQEVRIQRKNAFDGAALHTLMLKASREEDVTHGA